MKIKKTDFPNSEIYGNQAISIPNFYGLKNGEIDEIISNVGSNLIPGVSQILRLVNLDRIYAESFVSEKYISFINEGTEAIVQIPLLNMEIESSVNQTGNFINPSNRTFRIEVPVENLDNRIKQNLDAKIKINIYKKNDAIVIPLRIVREDALGKNFIYLMSEDNKDGVYLTSKRFITLGNKSENKVEVTEGLNLGDIVVLEGAYSVEDSQRVKLID